MLPSIIWINETCSPPSYPRNACENKFLELDIACEIKYTTSSEILRRIFLKRESRKPLLSRKLLCSIISERDIHWRMLLFTFPQDVFSSLLWSFFKTFIMMIGEIDYGSIVVEAKDQHNKETGAPLAPAPEFSAAIICFYCVMVSVVLMNLLVSIRYKYLYHAVENAVNQK